MKIGELARRTGLPASTIRFYESKGLLNAASRQANGYRAYPPETIALLSIITNAQQTGFTLDEIKRVMPEDLSDWKHEPLVALLKEKIADIQSMEARLAQNKANLFALLTLIDARPADMDCKDNSLRVMAGMGLAIERGKRSRG